MGFIINKSQPISFPALLTQLGIVGNEDEIRLPERAARSRSAWAARSSAGAASCCIPDDYDSESTVSVADEVSLTPTLDILKAISAGIGPKRGDDGARLCRLERRASWRPRSRPMAG